MTAAAIAGALAGLGVAVPVGAIALLLISLSARTSFKVGASAALGVATADGIYALIAVLVGAALAGLIAPISVPLRWVAAVVLLVIVVRMVVTAIRHYRDPASAREVGGLTTPGRAYGIVLGITLLNPMTIVYFGALVLGRRDSAELGVAGSLVFVVAAFLASAAWQLMLAGGGALVGRILTGPKGRLGTALVSGVVIAALAVSLVWS